MKKEVGRKNKEEDDTTNLCQIRHCPVLLDLLPPLHWRWRVEFSHPRHCFFFGVVEVVRS